MKWLFFHYDTFLEFYNPVREHQFALRCMPATNGRQRVVRADVTIQPATEQSLITDGFGNLTQTGFIESEHTSFHYGVTGEVFVSPDNKDKAPLNPVFCYPSELTKPSSEMYEFLENLKIGELLIYDIALKLTEEIYTYFTYVTGSTNVNTTAAEAFAAKTGVCQDYTHVFLSFARTLGIPARYANGLLVGEGVTHAWAEVYIDGAWVGFDPTNNRAVTDDYIRFCVGRDFEDCPIERGVFLNPSTQRQTIQIRVFEGQQQQ
ncbi:transglutaminase [Clostridia bacterium]|nr:transglutaminase [Clostridia bacterium]